MILPRDSQEEMIDSGTRIVFGLIFVEPNFTDDRAALVWNIVYLKCLVLFFRYSLSKNFHPEQISAIANNSVYFFLKNVREIDKNIDIANIKKRRENLI